MGTNLENTVEVLKKGGILIFPTDTAFGIGCRIDNDLAVKRLFEIRRRPENKPTPVLVDSIQMAEKYTDELPHDVHKLMEKYWPGGLTIVLKSSKGNVSPLVKGGLNTLGLRMPNHPSLLSVISQLGVPIIGSSANFAGERTPFKRREIDQRLINLVDYIMEGEAKGMQSSTVIDCTKKPWIILRHGAVLVEELTD